jgi:hypothetical protein
MKYKINENFPAPFRESVMQEPRLPSLANRGRQVDVRPVLVSELVEASKDGTLKEIFGAGTAAWLIHYWFLLSRCVLRITKNSKPLCKSTKR